MRSYPPRGYIDWRPGTSRVRARLEAVQDVLATYKRHLPLTLRQIFYVLVGCGITEKSQPEYRNLGYMLGRARRAQLIPFEHIHDQGSSLPTTLLGNADTANLEDSIRWTVEYFRLDPQLGQKRRLMLWCEAAGMLNQLRGIAARYGVTVASGGGYDSISDKWQLAQLVAEADRPVLVLHIGDLDRHGESIFDVLSEDVRAFEGNGKVEFERIAVTEQQVDELGLVSSFEDELVVQAEAIPPDVLAELVDDALRARFDLDEIALVAARSKEIREEYEAKLRAAGLWKDS
jgi:hypothetical protein